jgi:tripartite-type tricarboxylate transporter receptor subunit TctC
MKLPRRNFLHLAAGAAALPTVSRIARAQDYPRRPVRIIAGYPPGGSIDIHARLIGQWLSQRLGQPFVVENRPGAGGNVGSEAAAHAAPDGYTLLMSGIGNTISATLYDKLKYDFIRDFAPVAGVMRAANVIDVHPSVPVNSVPELIAYAKANPGKVTMGSSGVGTSPHLSGELFKLMTGVDMLHCSIEEEMPSNSCRGNAPALTDLLAGQLQVSSCRVSRRPVGTASARPKTRPPRSSTGSTRKSMQLSPTPRSRRGLPTWVAPCSRSRPPTLAS